MNYKNILKSILVFVVSLPTFGHLSAQEFFVPTEYGFSLGASTYFGDLNTNYGLHFIRPAGGVYIRHSFNPYIAIKGTANYTKVGYEDKFSSNAFQKIRNLGFRSDIIEAAVLAEFNFFYFQTGDKYHRFTPYLSGGIGGFYFDPYIHYHGQRFRLKDVGTEGQRTHEYDDRKYSNFSFCLPVGAGIKYWIAPGTNFSFEIINRFTFTDYLDDVSSTYVGLNKFSTDPNHPTPTGYIQDPSNLVNGQRLGRKGKQRGDISTKDQYLIMNLSLSFQFKTYKCPTRDFSNMYNR